MLGDDVIYQFEKCPERFCSEKIIDIEAPMPQLILLLEKSPICKQEITFNCFLAPIMVRTFLQMHKRQKWIKKYVQIRPTKNADSIVRY